MLTNSSRAALVQLLLAISPDAVRLLLIKHLDYDLWPVNTGSLLEIAAVASAEGMTGLLVEVVGGGTAIRADAPTKYVFDGRLKRPTRPVARRWIRCR